MRDLLIGGRRIADDTEAYVIADVGPDLWGDLERAEVLFLRAAMAGASAVLLDGPALYPVTRYDRPEGEPYGSRVRAEGNRDFGRAEYARMAGIAADLKLDLVPTASDEQSVEFLRDLGPDVPAIRIAPDGLTDLALVAAAAALRRPLLLAVRDATGAQVRAAVEAVRAADPARAVRPQVALLQCAEPEPRTAAELNLARLVTLLADHPDLVIGFSGWHVCPEQSWISYAVGARIVEKRFPAEWRPAAGRRRVSLDPLGLVRYDGRARWGDHSDPLRING